MPRLTFRLFLIPPAPTALRRISLRRSADAPGARAPPRRRASPSDNFDTHRRPQGFSPLPTPPQVPLELAVTPVRSPTPLDICAPHLEPGPPSDKVVPNADWSRYLSDRALVLFHTNSLRF